MEEEDASRANKKGQAEKHAVEKSVWGMYAFVWLPDIDNYLQIGL